MVCPQCGRSVPALPGGRCAACTAESDTIGAVAASGVVVSPTGGPLLSSRHSEPAISSADEVTRLASPQSEAAIGSHADSGRLSNGELYAGRYRIERFLGRGGMGEVYQAYYQDLRRTVALKLVLPPGEADSEAVNRFHERVRREIQHALLVTHPNVIRIHDLVPGDGSSFTMEYVEGRNLAQILKESGRLPVQRALRIARQVADGLHAAHQAGVIHRDLKPANIMIRKSDDRPLIVDFGIALAASLATDTTQTVRPVGTIQYMSPEQATAHGVDVRSDIYALGLILYDMLGGARHTGSGLDELIERTTTPLPSIRSSNPEVPHALARIISRCVETDPAKRFHTAAELIGAFNTLDPDGNPLAPPAGPVARLRRWSVVALVLAIGGLIGWSFYPRRSQTPASSHEPVSVLIADFENRTKDPAFTESIEQVLTIGIEGAPFIATYPRRDARALLQRLKPGATLDERMGPLIAFRENVQFVLAGSIDSSGGGYAIVVRLINPADGSIVGTATTTATTRSAVLPAVGKLAAEVRAKLGDAASPSERVAAAETVTATSPEALRDYTRAQDLSSNSKFTEALPLYERAIREDVNFGRAYSGLAVALFELGRRDQATEAWNRALSLMDRMTDREKVQNVGRVPSGCRA